MIYKYHRIKKTKEMKMHCDFDSQMPNKKWIIYYKNLLI